MQLPLNPPVAPAFDTIPRAMPRRVHLREVGLRDALQATGQHLSTTLKCDWLLLAHAAGLAEIEVGAVLPAGQQPGLDDTLEVLALAATVPGLRATVQVQSVDGARHALAAGAALLSMPLSASVAYAQARPEQAPQTGLPLIESLARECRQAAQPAGVEVVISAAFGCALQGAVAPDAVLALGRAAAQAGATHITLADTLGQAAPDEVHALFTRLRHALPNIVSLGAHLHHTADGTLGTVLAAAEAGVARFDVSLGGIGGSPLAPQAHGNVALDAVAALFSTLGVAHGVDLAELARAQQFVARHAPALALFAPRPAAASARRGRLF